jgi:predicted hydrolase (HD superfamily)
MSEGPLSEPHYGKEQAWKLLTEWTQSENLRKHALSVEICVSA